MARKGIYVSEAFTLYKLIILYMLEKLNFPLTNGQISEFILDKGYTNYFTLQQTLAEMVEANFIREETTHNRTLYHLTDEGNETIQFFKNNISPAIQTDIDTFIAEKRYELRNEVSVKADFYQNKNLEYDVRCQILENGAPLIDLTIAVPTEEQAETVANNWSRKNQEIYAQIMAELL